MVTVDTYDYIRKRHHASVYLSFLFLFLFLKSSSVKFLIGSDSTEKYDNVKKLDKIPESSLFEEEASFYLYFYLFLPKLRKVLIGSNSRAEYDGEKAVDKIL